MNTTGSVFSKNNLETRHQEEVVICSQVPSHHKTFPMSWVPEATLHLFTLVARCVATLPCLCPGCRTLSQDTMWLELFLE